MPLQHLDTVIAFALVMLLLSLLVTVLVQMVVTALYLRGKNLLWATELLIKQIDPDLEAEARNLAERVLRHPALSRAGHTLAVAMRKSELVLALNDLRKRRGGAVEVDLGFWRRLLRRVMRRLKGISGHRLPALAPATYERLDRLFEQVVRDDAPELTAKAQELLERLESSFPEQAKDLRGVVQETYRRTEDVVVKVDAWFDTVMDRSSDRFKGWSRAITAGASVVLVFALHIDSLALIHQLSTNDELRAALVQTADEVREEAGLVLPRTAGGAEAQISTPAEAQARLQQLGLDVSSLEKRIRETQLQLIPAGYCAEPPSGVTARIRYRLGCPFAFDGNRQLMGVLISAMLLSLGAPFWYNLLRRLADLRPVVARRAEGEAAKGAPPQS